MAAGPAAAPTWNSREVSFSRSDPLADPPWTRAVPEWALPSMNLPEWTLLSTYLSGMAEGCGRPAGVSYRRKGPAG